MRFISTNVHGVLDYLFGVFLIAMPWLMGISVGGPETWVPALTGGAIIFYSLITKYEWGLWPMMELRVHLLFDVLGGATLIFNSIYFGFYDQFSRLPFVAVGLILIASGLLTKTEAKSDWPRLFGGRRLGLGPEDLGHRSR